jgi:hypothetical protein
VRRERVRELADRDDEDEVEEELEPRRPPVVDVVARDGAEARRLDEAGKRQRPLKSGFRFSTKARSPSFASSDANAR